MSTIHLRVFTILVFVLGMAPAVAAQPIPLVVAVDTSRSLSATELDAVADRLRPMLEGLDPSTPTGLLAFDDEPRWMVEIGATPAQVVAALDDLEVDGDFTLLNDALFTASRALDDGGVVILVTDGRDEQSATTVEDIARRAEEQGVPILAAGIGRRVEVLALRRLAMVTDGHYLGRLDTVEDRSVEAALTAARGAVRAVRSRRAPTATVTEAAPGSIPLTATTPRENAASPAAASPSSERSVPPFPWLPILLSATLAALVALAVVWLRDRRLAAEPSNDNPFVGELPPVAPAPSEAGAGPIDDPGAITERLPIHRQMEDQLLNQPVLPGEQAREMTGNTIVFDMLDNGEVLEHTRVLRRRGVLWVREPGEDARSFELDDDRAFAIGRLGGGNTLDLRDPALSAQHCRIVPFTGAHYLLDLTSTNGSFVNGQRVLGATALKSGDNVRVGQVEMVYRSNTESF
ncbi:MAG: FHA domain-containing protein [Acidobacteriota bacterium]